MPFEVDKLAEISESHFLTQDGDCSLSDATIKAETPVLLVARAEDSTVEHREEQAFAITRKGWGMYQENPLKTFPSLLVSKT